MVMCHPMIGCYQIQYDRYLGILAVGGELNLKQEQEEGTIAKAEELSAQLDRHEEGGLFLSRSHV